MTLVVSCMALALPRATVGAQSAADQILGAWRIERATVAPWARRSGAPANRSWIGRIVTFAPNRVTGPGALQCGGARYTATSIPAEGLFQGALTAPTADAASLGLVSNPVPGVRLRCGSGVFEFHRADASTLLVALDNVVYTLDRSAGAFAPDTAPAGVVQRLLEHHFAGAMKFDKAHLGDYAPWLSTKLKASFAAYLAKPVDESEVPAINGDPFTDSQAYPTRFSVELGVAKGDAASVPVRFTFNRRSRVIAYRLRREGGAWRVDDLRYDKRGSLARLLK